MAMSRCRTRAGGGFLGVVQAIEADPTEEYLAGSPAATADEYRTLADDVNTLVGELSYAVQRAMPAIQPRSPRSTP